MANALRRFVLQEPFFVISVVKGQTGGTRDSPLHTSEETQSDVVIHCGVGTCCRCVLGSWIWMLTWKLTCSSTMQAVTQRMLRQSTLMRNILEDSAAQQGQAESQQLIKTFSQQMSPVFQQGRCQKITTGNSTQKQHTECEGTTLAMILKLLVTNTGVMAQSECRPPLHESNWVLTCHERQAVLRLNVASIRKAVCS